MGKKMIEAIHSVGFLDVRKALMTTFTTEDRIQAEKDELIKQLQEKIAFLQAKNKWLIEQVEQLEIQIWGSR